MHKSIERPFLEYRVQFWAPYHKAYVALGDLVGGQI